MQDITRYFDLTDACRILRVPNDVRILDEHCPDSTLGYTNHANPERVIHIDSNKIRYAGENIKRVIAHELIHLAQFIHYPPGQITFEHMAYSYTDQPHEIEAHKYENQIARYIHQRW